MIQIIEVDSYFVGPDDGVVVGLGVGLLGKQFFLIAVFDAGRTRDAGTEHEESAVVALQLVGIAGHVGARPHEAHLSDEDVDQLCEAVYLAVAQPVAYARDARVVGSGDRVAFRLVNHGAELTDSERFATFSDASLHEENRTFRVDFDEDADDEQRQKKHDESDECHDAVEAPLEEEPYFVFIFRHVAWPPC